MNDNQRAMHRGQLYYPGDPDITKKQAQAQLLMYQYNATLPTEGDKRSRLLRQMFAQVGSNCYIEPPFHANWAGKFVELGSDIYANFNLTLVDDTHIYIGDHTMIGPNVTLATAGHPIWPVLRERGYQYNLPVRIGKNCWLGAGVTVLPGVTIGDNTVVGAASTVTKDLPANVVAVGTPAKVMRPINEHDRAYYHGQHKIDPRLLTDDHD